MIGIDIHWPTLSITSLSLVGVGADYNLMYAARLRQEISSGGFGTGTIRTFANTGGVVTAAGIVFGITMFAMLGSSVPSIGQVGSTIGIGLILDTLIVRALLLPALASALRRHFWWPLSFDVGGGQRPHNLFHALWRSLRGSRPAAAFMITCAVDWPPSAAHFAGHYEVARCGWPHDQPQRD
ncbi:MMPL family transporter [Mycobacteroides abscessus]|uniref:MMPL family transporter n=1 Tax=Mycobacteroides abscessus TaxID=36809 RepID=UPI001F44A0AA|nr:MMPL family transporter [Mycobacteroides abscessus]